MCITPLIITTQSAAQFIVEKDLFPSVVCLILLVVYSRAAVKSTISTEDGSLLCVWTPKPPKDARRPQTQEEEYPNMTFASRWDRRQWEDHLMCVDASIDMQGVCVWQDVQTCIHACVSLHLSPLSAHSPAIFSFIAIFRLIPPPSNLSDLCILITLSNWLAGLQEHFPPFFFLVLISSVFF